MGARSTSRVLTPHVDGAAMQADLVSWEKDRNAWCRQQAEVLRSSGAAFDAKGLDWEKIAEELDGLSRSDRRELECRLTVLIAHLSTWLRGGIGGQRNANGWRLTIREQRRRIRGIVRESPSLKAHPERSFALCFADARLDAADQLALTLNPFPKEPPFTLEQVLDPGFPPDLMGSEA